MENVNKENMKHLPAETVRLLSSSQVITSVVNVVKELLENSLDAGSSSIEVKLERYGLDRIEVRDNGSGIKAADTPVMGVKHYTSKISSHEDLDHLETYGFRGEALGSICAVSEVVVTTKAADDDVSTQYTLDLVGQVVSQRPSHLGQGTTVCVLKLFNNLPVRRQYYSNTKKCKEELKKVQDLLMSYAIVKPELRITFTHNKAVVWQKARVSDHRASLMAVLGAASIANMLPLQHRQEQPEISIDGYFPKPGSDHSSMSSSNPDKTFIFVNSRPVHLKDVLKLVRQHCTNTAQAHADTASRRYPTLMMNITIPASTVDVNLTPDKTQVLLQNKEAVLSAVESMLISLYGSQSATEDRPMTEDRPIIRVGDEASSTGISPVHQKPVPGDNRNDAVLSRPPSGSGEAAPLRTLEHSSTASHAASETSLNQTANTSSSSSSEDWVINKSITDSVNFSLFDEDIALSCSGDLEDHSSPQGPETLGNQGSEISAESWSMGRAFTDPITGERLEPVKLHLPAEPRATGEAEPKSSSSPSKKASNVIMEKMAKLTAYDLISNRPVRQPMSPCALFEQETRPAVLQENPRASLQDVTTAVKARWESLGEEDRKKYEAKAEKALNCYNLQRKRASEGDTQARDGKKQPKADSPQNRAQGLKRKAPLSNQQILDKLFSSQPPRKRSLARPSEPLPFSLAALKQRLNLLPYQRGPGPQGLRLVNRLASHSAWVVLCGRKLMLLNPFRVEEALLFKRLLENNILPAASLQTPIQLTDGVLGGPEYTDVLCHMEKGCPELSGMTYYTDQRLTANGFQIKLTPGSLSTERLLEVTGMADCVPFFGIADLREILTAVKDRDAKTVEQCRPLKVTNYLEGEAVRLARQLPLNLSGEDVKNTLSRMEQQLEEDRQVCIHGRPFYHHLTDVPETDQDALSHVKNPSLPMNLC